MLLAFIYVEAVNEILVISKSCEVVMIEFMPILWCLSDAGSGLDDVDEKRELM